MHFKDVARGSHYLQCMARWHKAPETSQHKLTSISAWNVNFKGSAEPYGATIDAVRGCSSTQRLYLQSAMPHPNTEVLSRAGRREWIAPTSMLGDFNDAWGVGGMHANKLHNGRCGTRRGARKTQTPFKRARHTVTSMREICGKTKE